MTKKELLLVAKAAEKWQGAGENDWIHPASDKSEVEREITTQVVQLDASTIRKYG